MPLTLYAGNICPHWPVSICLKLFDIVFGFGVSLIILKFLKRAETYVLWSDGDADEEPIALLTNFFQGDGRGGLFPPCTAGLGNCGGNERQDAEICPPPTIGRAGCPVFPRSGLALPSLGWCSSLCISSSTSSSLCRGWIFDFAGGDAPCRGPDRQRQGRVQALHEQILSISPFR